jgi:hypothetical protein
MEVWGMLIEAAASLCISAALAVYVLGLRPRSSLHSLVLAVLACAIVWNVGMLMRWGSGGGAIAVMGFRVQYPGVWMLPPIFL